MPIKTGNGEARMTYRGARAPRPLFHAPRGTLNGAVSAGAPKKAGETPALPNSSARAGLKNLKLNPFNADFPALSAQQSHPDANLRVCLSKVRPELRRIPVDA